MVVILIHGPESLCECFLDRFEVLWLLGKVVSVNKTANTLEFRLFVCIDVVGDHSSDFLAALLSVHLDKKRRFLRRNSMIPIIFEILVVFAICGRSSLWLTVS